MKFFTVLNLKHVLTNFIIYNNQLFSYTLTTSNRLDTYDANIKEIPYGFITIHTYTLTIRYLETNIYLLSD